MKKKILSLTLICIISTTTLLTACGAAGEDFAPVAESPATNSGSMRSESSADAIYDSNGDYAFELSGGSGSGGSAFVPVTAPASEDFNEKIIYYYYADIETLEFDNTIADVNKMISAHGAFIENSEISGNNYASYSSGRATYRYAHFVIRVPVGQLNAVTAQLDSLGNIVSQNSNALNITTQFTDQQSRLNALRIQEERLLDMLSKTERITDMITIENSLTDVRYQIEHITTTLNNWQRQVDFSTLTLSIREVEEYKEIVPIQQTYWEKMGNGLMSTLRGIGSFFANLFLWFVVSAPVLIILAVIAIIVILIIKKQLKKNKERLSYARSSPASQQYTYPPVAQPETQIYPQAVQPEGSVADNAPEDTAQNQ